MERHGRGGPSPAGRLEHRPSACATRVTNPSTSRRSRARSRNTWNSFSVGYALNIAKTSDIDDPSFGHVVRIAHDYGRESRVGLAFGFGEEAETVAPGVVQVTDTRSVSLSGLHWTSTAWGISWEAGWYEQGDLYDRVRVRLGLEHRF